MSADDGGRRAPVRRAVLGTVLVAGVVAGVVVAVTTDDVASTASVELRADPSVEIHGTTPATRLVSATTGTVTSGTLREERQTAPDRVVVRDDLGTVATFTVGARTVSLRGPRRSFAESTTTATVATTAWVRLLDQPFTGTVDHAWLTARLADTSDDLLEFARQYSAGAPERRDASGSRVAGDASYGPLLADGTRQEGSDFNDFLGVPWRYGTRTDQPEAHQYGALDCSGYVRVVFGYRAGIPVSLDPDGASLPRRAVQMSDAGPGVVVIPNTGARPSALSALSPGDLVFFDASTDDGTLIDHVGIFLGADSTGAPRFLSSRKSADGPTMGDVRGRSTLSGTGLYATTFRAARRL